MAKVKVIFDRHNCIGARACAVVCPKYWGMADDKDGKANLLGSKLNEETGKYELETEASDQDLVSLRESAKACPINVIELVAF
ncbi:MAG: ferredoxin [Candidatus Nealsonbacteria bacterium]|nr:ferredoxin [Candidatus Nealsonbacteria bacterium]